VQQQTESVDKKSVKAQSIGGETIFQFHVNNAGKGWK
jgi:hypothetical protein